MSMKRAFLQLQLVRTYLPNEVVKIENLSSFHLHWSNWEISTQWIGIVNSLQLQGSCRWICTTYTRAWSCHNLLAVGWWIWLPSLVGYPQAIRRRLNEVKLQLGLRYSVAVVQCIRTPCCCTVLYVVLSGWHIQAIVTCTPGKRTCMG